MLTLPAYLKILISIQSIDMRKSIDGLTQTVVAQWQINPQERYLCPPYGMGKHPRL